MNREILSAISIHHLIIAIICGFLWNKGLEASVIIALTYWILIIKNDESKEDNKWLCGKCKNDKIPEHSRHCELRENNKLSK